MASASALSSFSWRIHNSLLSGPVPPVPSSSPRMISAFPAAEGHPDLVPILERPFLVGWPPAGVKVRRGKQRWWSRHSRGRTTLQGQRHRHLVAFSFPSFFHVNLIYLFDCVGSLLQHVDSVIAPSTGLGSPHQRGILAPQPGLDPVHWAVLNHWTTGKSQWPFLTEMEASHLAQPVFSTLLSLSSSTPLLLPKLMVKLGQPP